MEATDTMRAEPPSAQDLAVLARLPGTPELRAALAKATDIAAAAPDWQARFSADQAVIRARRRLELAEQRDVIAATRPEGCCCLGAGYLLDGVHCECPDGVAALAEHEHQRELDRQRNVARLLARAGIPGRFADFTLDSFPDTPATAAAVRRLRQWSPQAGRGLYMHGPFGSGKTGLAVATLRDQVRRCAVEAYFTSVPALLDDIRRSYGDDARTRKRPGGWTAAEPIEPADMFEHAMDVELLVLDDIGTERPTDWALERLFLLANHRHDHLKPTLYTSNLALDQLAERIGERTTWRVAEASEVLQVNGPNLRDQRAVAKARA